MPKRKKLDKRFSWTWQYALNKKYNEACDVWEKYLRTGVRFKGFTNNNSLPSEEEILGLLRTTPYQQEMHNQLTNYAKAIHKRIGGN